MRSFRTLPLLAFLGLTTGGLASAQSPEAVARAAFAAIEEKRYEDVPPLVDREALARFHQSALLSARSREEPPERLVGGTPREDPGVPACVAEYFEQQQARIRAELGSLLPRQYAGIHSLEELERLSPEEVLERWLAARDPEWQMRSIIDLTGTPLPDSLMAALAPRVARSVLGHVAEGDSLAHVTYRVASFHAGEAAPHPELQVVTLRRGPQGWRLLMGRGFLEPAHFAVSFAPAIGVAEDLPPPENR